MCNCYRPGGVTLIAPSARFERPAFAPTGRKLSGSPDHADSRDVIVCRESADITVLTVTWTVEMNLTDYGDLICYSQNDVPFSIAVNQFHPVCKLLQKDSTLSDMSSQIVFEEIGLRDLDQPVGHVWGRSTSSSTFCKACSFSWHDVESRWHSAC